jgi:hypothetical protein
MKAKRKSWCVWIRLSYYKKDLIHYTWNKIATFHVNDWVFPREEAMCRFREIGTDPDFRLLPVGKKPK